MIKWIICAVALVANIAGAPMTEPGPPGPVDASQGQPQFRPQIDCGRLGNGNYVYGCSATFYQCANGEAHPQICHRSLVLDPEQNACEIPAKVAVCQGDKMQNPSIVRAKDPFNCQGKPAGMYFLDCSGAYAYCDGAGNLGRRTCPAGTALDEARAMCDWPANVPACNKNIKHEKRNSGPPTLPRTAGEMTPQVPMGVAAPGYGPVQQSPPVLPQKPKEPQQPYGQQQSPPLLPRPQPQEPKDPYPQPVQNSPPQVPQQPYPQPQAPTLPPRPRDPYQPPQQSPPVLPQRPQNPYSQPPQQSPPQEPLMPVAPQLPIAPEFDCTTRADGIYASPSGGCVSFFWKCAHGQSFKYTCPQDLFFSIDKVECHRREDVPECNGQQRSPPQGPLEWKPPATLPPAQSPPMLPQQPQQPYGQPQLPPQQAPPIVPQQPQQPYGQPQLPPQQAPPMVPQQPQQPYGQYQPPQQTPPVVPQQPQTPYGQPQLPPQQSPPRPADNWCQGKSDGYQGEGCSSHYWYCAVGTTTRMHCPSGLFFDIETHQCNHKEWVVACGGQKPTQPPAQQSPPSFNCIGKTDGFYYSKACEKVFVQCVSGVAHFRNCPSNLVFNPNTEACDYVEACSELKPAQNPPQNPIGDHGNFNNYYGQSQTTQAPPQQSPPSFDCLGKSDGFYLQGQCISTYIQCANGIAHQYTCPAGLVFTGEMCEYKDICLSPTTPPAQNPPMIPQQPQQPYGQPQLPPQQAPPMVPQQPQQPYGQYQPPQQTPPVVPQQPQTPYGQPQLPPQQSPPRPADNWCQQNGKSDGYQGEGCSSHYWYCAAGTTTKMNCPAGLFFDIETHQCNHKEFIVACGGQKPTQPPAQSPPMIPQQPQQPYGQPQLPPQQAPPMVPQQPQQPYGQYQPPQQTPPVVPQQPQTPYGQPQMPPQQSPPVSIEDFCQRKNLNDGFYGEGCNNFFFVCSAGTTKKISCPAGLWYDVETRQCDHKELIVACGGQKPTQPPAQNPPMIPQQPQNPYGQPQLPPQQSPPAPVFDCSGKANGYYVQGCSSDYFFCNAGFAITLNCPAGTFYSAQTEHCDYKSNVVECGGQAPTQPPAAQSPVLPPQRPIQPQQPQQPYGQPPVQQAPPQQPATPAPAWVPQPYQPSQPQPQPQQQSPPMPTQIESVNTNPCLSLGNGIYGRKCSRFFFVCTNAKTFDFICPRDQAFDVKTSKCAFKTLISTCPEFQQVATPAPQQSPPVSQAVNPYSGGY
uniref:Chitin-binding type-2 domain-containing protein n=1 Tax=Panagrolaimus sp. JU765 TaxID=591449 RepID=A0AC34PX26_9BILA